MAVWDHPRACGEHPANPAHTRRGCGSSPRLRGTLGCALPRERARGIIPALAGNTHTYGVVCGLQGDHPRACGEHKLAPILGYDDVGSSPRLRGTLQPGVYFIHIAGIIPALAGNTWMRWAGQSVPRDHPRACGEHRAGDVPPRTCWGSSPRLRGTRAVNSIGVTIGGIIPALAGNTAR